MRERRPAGPQRHESSERLAKARQRSRDLQFALEHYKGRWTAASIAAACTLPDTARSTVEGWALLLDELDDAIARIVYG